MFLLDTNIIIYACRPEYGELRKLIEENASVVSIITKIEALGYHKLTTKEKSLIGNLFEMLEVVDLSNDIASRAIELRQEKRLTLGDAIIAATAMKNDLTLVTHNVDDFKHIQELKVFDPVQ